ncbi:MAG: TIGR02757 family protein [Candidatus Gastranaerophilales bacterium]|nr:TIGR02757 family protein [Candidatus Gastranaerophilales bacterium]
MKELLDKLAAKYETPDFIKSDPVQFPHRYSKKQDIEISGIISSSFAYGKRTLFIEKLKFIHSVMGKSPHEFCVNFTVKDEKHFENFRYRFNNGNDIITLINSLSAIYQNNNSLEDLLVKFKTEDTPKNILNVLIQHLYPDNCSKGFCYLLPNPSSNSACKRLNLFLKWMVRGGSVDLNNWTIIDKKNLIIPLDTHVARISRYLNLTSRKSNDWTTAREITDNLKKFDANDPVKYDFALFGYGVEHPIIDL